MPFILYCITNAVNGKKYIGITSTNTKTRIREHFYVAKHKRRNGRFHKAIRKYGTSKFSIAELAVAFTYKGLREMERLAISQHNTNDKTVGYNSTTGGEGCADRRTAEKWVSVAEYLAQTNDGKLQPVWWLVRNGYSGIYRAMKTRPELFSHIAQEKPYENNKSPEQWLLVAEEMTKCGKALPGQGQLSKMNMSGLVHAIRNHPSLFIHIKQDILVKSYKEWVGIAEQIANKEPDKMLPSVKELYDINLGALFQAMQKYPELFAHIKQRNYKRTPEYWVAVAEKLAGTTNGILPNKKALRNRKDGLASCMRGYPHLFKHIPQHTLIKSSAEWVSVAEDIVSQQLDGMLPSGKQLDHMGLSGLRDCFRKRADLFLHITQRKLNSHGRVLNAQKG